MNILTLNFIRDESKFKKKDKKIPVKNLSKTQKRKIKRLRKIKTGTLKIDNSTNVTKTTNNINNTNK